MPKLAYAAKQQAMTYSKIQLATPFLIKGCALRWRSALALLIASMMAIQGVAGGTATSLPLFGGTSEGEAEPTRSEESSEETCHEQIGLSLSPRGRRVEVGVAEVAARLPAIKSQLVVTRHFVSLPPAGEHSCRNGLGAPLRC